MDIIISMAYYYGVIPKVISDYNGILLWWLLYDKYISPVFFLYDIITILISHDNIYGDITMVINTIMIVYLDVTTVIVITKCSPGSAGRKLLWWSPPST